jgi:hypothetical protein
LANVVKSSGRRNGARSLRLETCKLGSHSSARDMALSCRLKLPGERMAGCRNAYGQQECRIVARCLFRARRRQVIAAREKMSIRHASVHAEHVRIERTQAHGTRDVLKCEVRLASPDPQPGTKRPSLRCVGIDRQSPIHESRSVVELLGYEGECISPIHGATGSSPPRCTAFRAIRTASSLS